MPTPTIGTKIALEGEKEYKSALKEIDSGLRELKSEMDLTTTAFAENADSVEALAATGDVLDRQISSQREKVQALQEALQHSAEAFGEADKKTTDWKIKLNKAEADLIKMERAQRDNTEALEAAQQQAGETGDAMEDLGKALESTEEESQGLGEAMDQVTDKLGVSLPDGAKKALDSLGKLDPKIMAIATSAAAAVAALIKVEKALADLTKESAERATTLGNLASTVGMSAEATQQWDYVLKTLGSSMEEAQGDLSAFQEKIVEASTGEGEAAEMFAKLGINVRGAGGEIRSTEEVLLETVKALQLMTNETERNATSSTLLGGTGEKLIPIYNQTGEQLEALLAKKTELGILTTQEIATLGKVTQATLDYEERTKAAKDTIAAEFAPALAAFMDQSGTQLQDLGETAADSHLVDFFASLLELANSLLPAFDLLERVMELLEPVFYVLADAVSALADIVSILLNGVSALINLLTFDFSGAADNMAAIGGIINGGNSATVRTHNAAGDSNFRGGFTWVGENGPELVRLPQGTQIQTAQSSRMGTGDTFYITIDAKSVREFNDIIRIVENAKRSHRMAAPY